jgi:alpha-ketoglutaric semialdehyde dehydrogenase
MATAVAPRVYKNFINGEWVDSQGGSAYENRNPANADELVGMFVSSTSADVDAAVDAAKAAYSKWRLTPAPKRAEILFRAAELLVQRKEELSKDMTREMGKVLTETRGDVQEAIDMTYYMAGEGRRLFGQTTPSELPNKFAMSVRQSIGVCGMITPWNFPMAIPSWKMMPALISGNTVVLKPAEDTPLSSYHLVQILTEAGVPRGVVNLVSGDGPNAGAPLAAHLGAPVISFTGSTAVGRLIAQACAPNFKHCSLEMGGKNIIIVMNDANLDLAIDGAVWGGFGTTGQRCTAASRIAVHKSVYHEFVTRFVDRVKKLKVGDGLDSNVEMGPCINQQQLKTVMDYVEIGKNQGAKLLTGGNRLDSGTYAKGWFHAPTVFGDCSPTMRIAQEEIFGPVLLIMPYDNEDDAVDIANSTIYGLHGAVFAGSDERAGEVALRLRTGQVDINGMMFNFMAPFGGYRQSGNGKELGVEGLEAFLETKTLQVAR